MKIREGKEKNSKGETPIIVWAAAFYEQYKFLKMSVDASSNVYLLQLNEKKEENQQMCYNLCWFFHNQLQKDWYIDKKNLVFSLLEALTNFLFIATNSIQTNFFKVLKSNLLVKIYL